MEIGVYRPILIQNKSRGSMGQQYPYSTRQDKNSVVILHIYGARAIILLFCDNQENKSES